MKNKKKMNNSSKKIYETDSKLDYPGISYPGAFFLIFSSFMCIVLLPKILRSRMVFVILSALIISLSFVLSSYKIGKNKRKLDNIFVIKLIVSFIIVGFVFMLAFYKK